MEAMRIEKIVTDDRVREIMKYKGMKVEIIILPVEEKSEKRSNRDKSSFSSFRGSCPDIIDGLELQKRVREEWER